MRTVIRLAATIARHLPSRYASEAVRASWRFAPRPGPSIVDVEGIALRVDPATNGVLDQSLYYLGTYEAGLLDLIDRTLQPGDVAVDVGAYNGLMSLRMAAAGAEVHAFEPANMALLQESLRLNPQLPVKAYPVALGSTESVATLRTVAGNAGGTSVAVGTGDVEVVPLDSFRLSPRFVKIDVEGHEAEVLRGAKQTLARSKPIVVVEVSRKTGGGEETLRLLSDLGYRLFRLARGKEVPSRLRPLRKLPRHDNVIAVPS